MAKTIVILGASHVGLKIAHKLLKTTLKSSKEEFKVIIVSPTTHYYWNLASVRAIVPGQLPDEKLFASIPDALKQYGSAIEFVLGLATAVNPDAKTVTVSTEGKEKKQQYDILIIATGSRTIGDEIPWKSSNAGYEATKSNLHHIQDQVKKAESIVIGGAGPTGCEVAGELGFEYGLEKEISLVTSGSQVLADLPTHIGAFAENELKKLQVNIIKDVKVLSSTPAANGKTSVTLSDGTTMDVDLYLPTTGVVPNSEFLPESWLNEKGQVMVDQFLGVKNAESVWAAGDVTDVQPPQIIYAAQQTDHLLKNLDLVLNGKDPIVYRTDGAPMIGITLGRSKGTGRYGNIRIPSLVIWWKKGRTLGTEVLPMAVNGE